MKYPLISHELPKSLESEQHLINDYVFALLHKAIEDKEYLDSIIKYKEQGGFVILDNSCFELGASLDNNLLYEYYLKVKPDVVVLPDVLGNYSLTSKRTTAFLKDYPETLPHAMAVIQGSSVNQMIDCYCDFAKLGVKWIGIPFVYSWVNKDPTEQTDERIRLLNILKNYVSHDISHHLLGTWQAREFAEYHYFDWIKSIDTSNPIMAALDGIRYGEYGIDEKPKMTFDKAYGLKKEEIDMELLYYNVERFRKIAKRG